MNSQKGSCPARHYSIVDPGEATTGCGGGGADDGFLGMFGGSASSGDLFDLVWQGGARGGGGGSGGSLDVQPTGHLPSSPAAATLPPWEDEMAAAQLYPIVQGDELCFTGQDDEGRQVSKDDGREVPRRGDELVVWHNGGLSASRAPANEVADLKREELLKTQEKCPAEDSSNQRRKKARKSHHAETHSLTEKRRRCKINEKLKTLQQLVPGCDKSNQVSTLNQTIQYIKLLQQQIQAMSFGCGVNPAAVYHVMPPPYLAAAAAGTAATAGLLPPAATSAPGVLVRGHVRPGVVLAPPPSAMVPSFGPLLPLVQATSAPMLYSAPAPPNVG